MEPIELYRVGVALLYHEARHVRRVTLLADRASWGTLRALPADRWQAWQRVRPFLLQSARATTSKAIEAPFRTYFGKSLDDLERLFREGAWPRNFGGAKWGMAAVSVRGLGEAIDSGDASRIQSALVAVRAAEHNTGSLMDKYRQLESRR